MIYNFTKTIHLSLVLTEMILVLNKCTSLPYWLLHIMQHVFYVKMMCACIQD